MVDLTFKSFLNKMPLILAASFSLAFRLMYEDVRGPPFTCSGASFRPSVYASTTSCFLIVLFPLAANFSSLSAATRCDGGPLSPFPSSRVDRSRRSSRTSPDHLNRSGSGLSSHDDCCCRRPIAVSSSD